MSGGSRWCFTYHNYDPGEDYLKYLAQPEFKIKRAVWGYEVSPSNGTPHLQGYVEFYRTYRMSYVKKIFSRAHWEPARYKALQNYNYCIKNGRFETIGEWDIDAMVSATSLNRRKSASVGMIVAGLLSEDAPLVRVSREYSLRPQYYEDTADYVYNIRMKRVLFEEWKSYKLSTWQYKCFLKLVQQPERKILWVFDDIGNSGKTWLANYLHNLYNYDLMDGVLQVRDISLLLSKQPTGVCFDCSRSSKEKFDYHVLEAVKNGYLVSGKYKGTVKKFATCPVVVFSNFVPDESKLSVDRWEVVTLGEGEFENMSTTPIFSTESTHPFQIPPKLPCLDAEFSLKKYLMGKCTENTLTDFSSWSDAGSIKEHELDLGSVS